MIDKSTENDPKGLIYEAYRIDGITKSECRSIFLDWALSLPMDSDVAARLTALLNTYSVQNPTHPMTEVITEGQASAKKPRRRGGWRARARNGSNG